MNDIDQQILNLSAELPTSCDYDREKLINMNWEGGIKSLPPGLCQTTVLLEDKADLIIEKVHPSEIPP